MTKIVRERLKDLIRHRNTVEQGLTLKQIFGEIYPGMIEESVEKKYCDLDEAFDYYESYQGKIAYLRRIINRVRREGDDFRWLSVVPVKRNEVDPITGKKVMPYVEYRYVNLKAFRTPELVDKIEEHWRKHKEACPNQVIASCHSLYRIMLTH